MNICLTYRARCIMDGRAPLAIAMKLSRRLVRALGFIEVDFLHMQLVSKLTFRSCEANLSLYK